jgi:hypothetical protein
MTTDQQNLRKARMKWGRISRILSMDGADPKAMASLYKAIVVQSVLLYGSESWVLVLLMEKKITEFSSPQCPIHYGPAHKTK